MQLEDLTEHSLTLEKERDFYFGKVSKLTVIDIELDLNNTKLNLSRSYVTSRP